MSKKRDLQLMVFLTDIQVITKIKIFNQNF